MNAPGKFLSIFLVASLAVSILWSPAVAASTDDYIALQRQQAEQPSEIGMAADLLIARPLLLMATVAGTGLFFVSLPFSVLGGNVKQSGSQLVAKPAKATFVRCLGCISSR